MNANTSWQGVFTNAAVEFGHIMDSPAFAVISTGLFLLLLIIWLVNQAFTIKELINGRIVGLENGWIKQPEWKTRPTEMKIA